VNSDLRVIIDFLEIKQQIKFSRFSYSLRTSSEFSAFKAGGINWKISALEETPRKYMRYGRYLIAVILICG